MNVLDPSIQTPLAIFTFLNVAKVVVYLYMTYLGIRTMQLLIKVLKKYDRQL